MWESAYAFQHKRDRVMGVDGMGTGNEAIRRGPRKGRRVGIIVGDGDSWG